MSQPEPPPDSATTPPDPPAAPAYPQAIHVRPTAPLAERVLLPGDPGRALALAQTLLEKPLMFNHHRGLWGYTGPTRADGEPLTIQATGMGGPSAAIVLSELIALGARRLIRVGTCGALAPGLALGDLVLAREAICADGTSRALLEGAPRSSDRRADLISGAVGDPVDPRSAADPALAEALLRAGRTRTGSPERTVHAGTVVSVDLFYDSRSPRHPSDALAIEMEAAALFAVGAAASVPVACLLAVSDTFDSDGRRTHIDDPPLLAAAEAMGAVAVTAFSA